MLLSPPVTRYSPFLPLSGPPVHNPDFVCFHAPHICVYAPYISFHGFMHPHFIGFMLSIFHFSPGYYLPIHSFWVYAPIYSFWVYAPIYSPGFMHPYIFFLGLRTRVFSWVYAPILVHSFWVLRTHTSTFLLGFTHPYIPPGFTHSNIPSRLTHLHVLSGFTHPYTSPLVLCILFIGFLCTLIYPPSLCASIFRWFAHPYLLPWVLCTLHSFWVDALVHSSPGFLHTHILFIGTIEPTTLPFPGFYAPYLSLGII
jgi:hypothetical protein